MIPALGATNQLKKDQQNASHEKNPEHLVQLQVQLNLWTSPDNESLGQPLQNRIRFFINLGSSLKILGWEENLQQPYHIQCLVLNSMFVHGML